MPASWNPVDGRIAGAGKGNSVVLSLAPYESRVIVFSKQAENAAPVFLPILQPKVELRDWKVTFEGPAITETLNPLKSWTDDERTKYFSGSAAYETSFERPAENLPYYLNLGEGTSVETVEKRSGNGMRAMFESPVREAAKVYVNVSLAGSVWCPPYEIEVTRLLHAGKNTIRIVVANLAINQLAKGPLPDYKALNAKYGERFQPQDLQNLQPVPAGLLEPVRIIGKRELVR